MLRRIYQKLVPRPHLSVFLLVLWLFLVNSVSPAQILIGGMLALLIPYGTLQYWPEQSRIERPWLMVRYVLMVLGDIVAANINVARLLLRSPEHLKPAIISVPLDIDDPFAITILSSSITLSPGTVSMSLSDDRKFLMIHALTAEDEASIIAEVKTRYEARLKEIFGC